MFSAIVDIFCSNYDNLESVYFELVIFTVTPSKIKMEIFKYRKSRNWKMKEDKYTKSLAKNQVCAILHMRRIF